MDLEDLIPDEPIQESVQRNRRKRFCRHCKQRLSSYNLGKYCFVHSWIGTKKEMELEIKREKRTKSRYWAKKRRKNEDSDTVNSERGVSDTLSAGRSEQVSSSQRIPLDPDVVQELEKET